MDFAGLGGLSWQECIVFKNSGSNFVNCFNVCVDNGQPCKQYSSQQPLEPLSTTNHSHLVGPLLRTELEEKGLIYVPVCGQYAT